MPNKRGLIPYRVQVYPKSGKPYTTTRWKTPEETPIHVIPTSAYLGNLFEVFQAWQGFLGRIQDITDDLLRPIVALQEILVQGRAGVLAVKDNRVIGVATLQTGEDHIAASPLDQLQGKESEIVQTLEHGLEAYEMVD